MVVFPLPGPYSGCMNTADVRVQACLCSIYQNFILDQHLIVTFIVVIVKVIVGSTSVRPQTITHL